MSFSAEMRDFLSAFKTTSSVASDIRDSRDKRKKDAADAALNPSLEDLGGDWSGAYMPDLSGSEETTADKNKVPTPSEEKPRLGTERFALGGAIKTGTQAGRAPLRLKGLNKVVSDRWKATQDAFGRELPVVSAYRDPETNRRAGGAKHSQHMHGNAIDIDVSGLSKPQRLELIKNASANGFTGIGVYNNSLHLDVGGRRAWGPSYHADSVPSWARDTIAQHMGGKFGDYEPTAMASADDSSTDAGSERSALPVSASTRSERPTRSRQAYEDDGGSEQVDVLEGSRSAGVDIADIEIPEGVRPYTPQSLTDTPTAMAGGGSVPWAGATSQVAARQNVPTYRPTAAAVPTTTNTNTEESKTQGFTPPWGTDTMKYLTDYQDKYAPSYVARMNDMYDNMIAQGWKSDDANNFISMVGFSPMGGLFVNHGTKEWRSNGNPFQLYADGGTVEDGTEEDSAQAIPTAPVTSQSRANRDTVPQAEAPVGYNSKNDPAGPRRSVITPGQALHVGLTYLTHKHSLDKNGAAVGDDPQMENRQRQFVNGAIAPNEGPPSTQEVQQIFQVVDPKGSLSNGLRTVYAMQKGVEFYLSHGDVDKAGKWAAGLIQYSNLMSRRYGYEAVKAGKNGDVDGMVKYAIKAYESVPDGMDVQANRKGNGVEVTRTDENGDVVDRHMLSPQQIFQMATGISRGSGYFEALTEVASPGTTAADRKEKRAVARAGNLNKLLPDIKGDMDQGELEAWSSAVEDGDYETLNKILSNVQTRRREKGKEEAQTKRDELVDRRITEAREAAEANLDKRLAAADERQQRGLEAVDKRAEDRETARTAADVAKRQRRVNGKVKLRADYEADMTTSEKEQWDAAVEEVDPDALDDIMGNVDKRRETKHSDERVAGQNKAISDRQAEAAKATSDRAAAAQEATTARDLQKRERRAGTLNELFDAYAPQMTPGQKRAWQKAFQDKDPETLQIIIDSINRSYGAPMAEEGESDTGSEGAIPTQPQVTTQSNSGAEETKTINGKTYVKRGNKWFEK